MSQELPITDLMKDLAEIRPLFHSEADFKHALAMCIESAIPECSVRLEYRPPLAKSMYLDLWLVRLGIAIELKYRTRKLNLVHNNESFDLRDHRAADIGRYDFIKDVERLESLSKYPSAQAGMAIFLTNDPSYWNEPTRSGTVDSDFHLYEGRQLCGNMAWSEQASKGTKVGREEPIRLHRSYDVRWRDYSDISGLPRQFGRFRYLLIHTLSLTTETTL